MHEAQVVKLWVSYAETHPETLIDNESNHLRHQSLNLGVAYAEGTCFKRFHLARSYTAS